MLEYISSSCNDSHSRRKLAFSCASLPFSFTKCSSWCRTCSASGSDPPGSCDSWWLDAIRFCKPRFCFLRDSWSSVSALSVLVSVDTASTSSLRSALTVVSSRRRCAVAAATLRVFSACVGDLASHPQSSSASSPASPVFIGMAAGREPSPEVRDLLFFPDDPGERNTLILLFPLPPFPPPGLLDPPLFGVRRPPGDRGFLFHRRLGELASLFKLALFPEFGERLDSGAR